jgi:Plasmid replication region DNA-binding N-term
VGVIGERERVLLEEFLVNNCRRGPSFGREHRLRVTAERVAEVAEGLLVEGRRPTLERIRERIAGSPNTIALHWTPGGRRWPRACRAPR